MPNISPPISVRDHMVAQAAGERPFFTALKSLELDAFELQIDPDLSTPYVKHLDGSAFSLAGDAQVVAFKTLLAGEGVRVSAVLLMTDFSSDARDDQVQWAIRATQLAAELGAPAVRVDPLTKKKEMPQAAVLENFASAIKRVLAETAGIGVDLGIENHGPFGNAPEFLDGIFSAVDDPRLGMTLDTGNFYWWGVPLEELYLLLERYAPQTKHTHIKNINYPPEIAAMRRPVGLDYGKYCCALDEGNIDLRRVAAILRKAGYQRDFCIENESLGKSPPEGRLDVLKREVQSLRRALEGA